MRTHAAAKHYILLSLASLLLFPTFASAQSDFQFTLNYNGTSDYVLTEVSSDEIFSGELPANDPTLTLEVGKRYEITNLRPIFHPFEVLAKGTGPSDDVVLLSQKTDTPLANDGDINWVSDGMLVEFTVTPALVEAMNQSDNQPGYRCGNHTFTMRGDFDIVEAQTEVKEWMLF